MSLTMRVWRCCLGRVTEAKANPVLVTGAALARWGRHHRPHVRHSNLGIVAAAPQTACRPPEQCRRTAAHRDLVAPALHPLQHFETPVIVGPRSGPHPETAPRSPTAPPPSASNPAPREADSHPPNSSSLPRIQPRDAFNRPGKCRRRLERVRKARGRTVQRHQFEWRLLRHGHHHLLQVRPCAPRLTSHTLLPGISCASAAASNSACPAQGSSTAGNIISFLRDGPAGPADRLQGL